MEECVCEWCDEKATAFVEKFPTKCKIIYCNKHKTTTWHAPKKELEDFLKKEHPEENM